MKRLKNNLIMFIKFGCVGVINTIIDTGVFYVLCDILKVDELISNVIAYMVAATNSYLMNAKGVYKEEHYTFLKYFKFLLGNTSVLIISTLALIILSGYIESGIIRKLISVPVTTILNFVFQRFILFKKSADRLECEE